ncbi:hypothetical protein WJX77_001903 [Trebouxia sp. C0004]
MESKLLNAFPQPTGAAQRLHCTLLFEAGCHSVFFCARFEAQNKMLLVSERQKKNAAAEAPSPALIPQVDRSAAI